MTNLTLRNAKEAVKVLVEENAEAVTELSDVILSAVKDVITEFKNPKYTWRTLDGIAEDCNFEIDDVAVIVMALIEGHRVITARYPNVNGKKLYNFRGHVKVQEEDSTLHTYEIPVDTTRELTVIGTDD